MPAEVDPPVKRRSSIKRVKVPARTTKKAAPTRLSDGLPAAPTEAPSAEKTTPVSATAKAAAKKKVSPEHSTRKKEAQAASVARKGSALSSPKSLSGTAVSNTEEVKSRAQDDAPPTPPRSPDAQADAAAAPPDADAADLASRRSSDKAFDAETGGDSVSREARDDDVDTATSSSSVSDREEPDGGGRGGSTRRAPELVTSLAGKRHTRTVMTPPSAVPGTALGLGLSSAVASGSGTTGQPNARLFGGTYGTSGRRTNAATTSAASSAAAVSASSNGGGAGAGSSASGGHRSGDSTLRYRTDLDKQVIHFMFERYHQEQVCSTASQTAGAASLSPAQSRGADLTDAAEGDANSGNTASHHNSHGSAGSGRLVGSQTAATTVRGAASGTAPAQRSRRIAVEEIYVPANGEGEDKNIGLGDWHFFWMHVGRVRHTICSSDFRWQDQQIINHFPDHAELTRKDLMYKNIKRYLRENQANNYAKLTLHTAMDWVSAAANATAADGSPGSSSISPTISPTAASANAFAGLHNGNGGGSASGVKAFCFADSVPITYNIPNDMSMFKEECQKRRGTQWIVKPTSRSQGKGIFIIDDVRALQRWVREKKDAENMASFLATGPANRATWVAPSVLQQQRAAQQSALEAAQEAAAAAAGGGGGTGTASAAANGSGSANGGGGGGMGAGGAAAAPSAAGPTAAPTAPGPNSTVAGGGGAYIVSRYISNPLLIGGKKFDLRLYVLVTSYKPLVAYLHEDGFARFCATRYNGSSLAQEDLGSHLTNVALQKGDEHYNTSHGGKWSFQNLFLYVQARYGPYAAEGMMQNIQFLIYHSLKAVEPVMFNDKHCFELYGYDILIDDQINPHLIEVNASPSMSTTTVSDRLLKEQVLTDTMKILFPPGFPANSKAMPYWEYRQRTDLTTQQQTGFKLLQF